MIQCTASQELQKNAHHNIQDIFFKLLVLSDQQFNQFNQTTEIQFTIM